jgi:FkbM family methyltransferase
MTVFISYAQNFEDVILWRALKHIEQGFYIDIGAQDPIADSVSLAFYQKGWRGLHVEPLATYAAALRRARPDEIVIEAVVGDQDGEGTLFEISDTGLSTTNSEVAARQMAMGRIVRETKTIGVTLGSIFESNRHRDVHWLKIDVEGGESAVIRGWGASEVRPWIVVIESVNPLSIEDDSNEWEDDLCALGYEFAYFDGLNRFYVSIAHRELKSVIGVAPNVFDGFALSGTSSAPFCYLLQRRLEEQAAREADLTGKFTEQTAALDILKQEYATREADLTGRLAEQTTALDILKQEYATREADLTGRLAEHAAALDILKQEYAAREADLTNQLTDNHGEIARLNQVIHEQNEWGRASLAHVGILTDQLSAMEEEYATRAADLTGRIAEQTAALDSLKQEYATREADLANQLTDKHGEIARLHQVIYEKDEWGRASVAHVGILNDQLSAMKQEYATREAGLTGRLAEQTTALDILKQEHATWEADPANRMVDSNREMARLHQVIHEQNEWARESAAQVGILANQLAAIYQSTSWRLTRPLRVVSWTVSSAAGHFVRLPGAVVRLPGAVMRRSAALVRRRAPKLYGQIAVSRLARRLYSAVRRSTAIAQLSRGAAPERHGHFGSDDRIPMLLVGRHPVNAVIPTIVSLTSSMCRWNLGSRVDA